MRIMRVISRLEQHGGAEVSTILESQRLAERGHDVVVVSLVAPPSPGAVTSLDEASVEYAYLPGRIPQQVMRLRKLMRTWEPDVVHAVIFQAEVVVGLASLFGSTPAIASLVNMQYTPEATSQVSDPWKLEVMRHLESLVLRIGFRKYHCLTSAGAQHSVDRLSVPSDRIEVIPRGRIAHEDLVQPERDYLRHEDLDIADAPIILNVGRQEAQKGQELLPDIVDELRRAGSDAHVVVAGRSGNHTAVIKRRIEELGLEERIHLVGDRRDVPQLLRSVEIVAVTSRWEGLGGAVIEALESGSVVVAFDTPAVREVVGDVGVLIDPFDTAAFAQAIRDLLLDPGRRENLSDKARHRFIEHFEIEHVVDRIEDMYREAIT